MKSVLLKAAKEAGKIVKAHYGNAGKLGYKNPRSIVTKVDLLSEKKIIGIISKKYPEHNFITEESGSIKKGSEYTWIIDPIDGTTNFVSGLGNFAVCIALAKKDEVLMGAVYDPCEDSMFFAEKGKGAFLNNKKIKVSSKNNLGECILAFNLPSNVAISKDTLLLLSRIYGEFRGIRNFGSAALNMCYLAQGKFDLYMTKSINSWDVAAAKIIVEESNGKVTNPDGSKWNLDNTQIIASNKILHDKFVKLIR